MSYYIRLIRTKKKSNIRNFFKMSNSNKDSFRNHITWRNKFKAFISNYHIYCLADHQQQCLQIKELRLKEAIILAISLALSISS